MYEYSKIKNLEAERNVLGYMIVDNKYILEKREIELNVNDFFYNEHRIIYRHMLGLLDKSAPIDFITLSDSLKKTDQLDVIGGMYYLTQLVQGYPASGNIDYHMKIIKECSVKREIEYSINSLNLEAMDIYDIKQTVKNIDDKLLQNSNINDFIINASSIPLKAQELATIKTGFFSLDVALGGGLALGTLSVLTGIPGTGKSTFLNQVIANTLDQNYNVFLYSGELTIQSSMDWFAKTVASPEHLEMCSNNYGKYTKIKEEGFELIRNWIDNRFFTCSKDMPADEKNITHVIEYLATKRDVKLFIIDNLMTLDFSGVDKNDKQISIVKTLKDLAKKYDIAIIMVAHSNKGSNMNREAHVFDISGASEIPNLSDYVFKAVREKDRPETSIIVLKNRINGTINQKIKLIFSKERKRFFTGNGNELQKKYGYANYVQENIFDKIDDTVKNDETVSVVEDNVKNSEAVSSVENNVNSDGVASSVGKNANKTLKDALLNCVDKATTSSLGDNKDKATTISLGKNVKDAVKDALLNCVDKATEGYWE